MLNISIYAYMFLHIYIYTLIITFFIQILKQIKYLIYIIHYDIY